jgi:hypothetical protein
VKPDPTTVREVPPLAGPERGQMAVTAGVAEPLSAKAGVAAAAANTETVPTSTTTVMAKWPVVTRRRCGARVR